MIRRDGTIDGAAAARSPRVVADDRTFAYVLHDRATVARAAHHPERRARDPARQGRAARRRAPADGPRRRVAGRFDSVRLAGAFGSHIDPLYALVLGLIPDCDPAIARNVGNAAGAARCGRCCPHAARAEIAGVARTIVKIETAIEPALPGALRARAMGDPRLRRRGARCRSAVAATRHERRARPHRRPTTRRDRMSEQSGDPSGRERRDASSATAQRRPRRPAGGPPRRAHRGGAVPHPDAEAVRGGERGGPRDHRAQRRHDPRGGRRHRPRLPRGARAPAPPRGADVDGERVRFPRGMCRSIVQATAPAVYTQHAPQPGAQRADRRRRHGVRAELRLAVRARPRRAAAATPRSPTSRTS